MTIKNTVAQLVINATEGAAGTTDINGDVVDMANFEEVTFEVAFGAIVSGAVTSVKAQQGQQSDGSDMADLAGTGITVADTDDDKLVRLTIVKPQERYVRCVVDRGTQNAVVGSAAAIKSRPRKMPVTQHADVAGSEEHVGPAEGTA